MSFIQEGVVWMLARQLLIILAVAALPLIGVGLFIGWMIWG